jgi:uncharacterized repeat protein (TIGR01451 family)
MQLIGKSGLGVRRFVFALAATACTALWLASAGSAATGDLYAVTGAGGGAGCTGGTLSSLYTLDPATGAATLVGPIEVDSVQMRHVTGLAVHPSTGVLYAVAGDQTLDCSGFGDATLMTVDPATGAATVVGNLGTGNIPDMSFDPFGTLYAWSENGDDLYTVSLADGSATQVGECFCGTAQTGLAIDSAGRIFVKSSSELFRASHVTGASFGSISLDQSPQNILAFDPSDVLFTGTRSSTGFTLQTIDMSTGVVTDIGSNTVTNIGAIAFDPGVVTPPDQADLSLTKDVDVSSQDIGSNVVFTLTVSNAGPDAATGVSVEDLLPFGYDYVSDSPSAGSYDSLTGIWTVGTVAASGSETLEITALVTGSGSDPSAYTNTAEVVAADTYDSDSEPGEGDPSQDIVDSETVAPLNTSLDGAAELDVNGPTKANAKNKGFVVFIRNLGSVAFGVNSSNVAVLVNGSSSFVSCKSFNATISPGSSLRIRCGFNAKAAGVTAGSTVTYEATVDVFTDGTPGNNTDTFAVTAT